MVPPPSPKGATGAVKIGTSQPEIRFTGISETVHVVEKNTSSFVRYLSTKTPHMSDGTQSTWDFKNAWCGYGNRLTCNSPFAGDIKKYFAENPDSAITETASYPLTVFFRPSAIDVSTNGGRSLQNEAMFFHEALHGMTGLYDHNLAGLGPSLMGQMSQVDSTTITDPTNGPSSEVTDYIRIHVLSVCPIAYR